MLNTDDIVNISLKLVDMKELPKDSAVYVKGENIQKILYGIDIGTTELLYAKENNFDCVIAHHPVGVVESYKEFERHLGQLQSKGIPTEEASKIVLMKMQGFKFGSHARNYDAVPAFARLLKIPFLNIHCPSDELGRRLVAQAIRELDSNNHNSTLNDLKDHLEERFVEFRKAKTDIEIAKGNSNGLLGNWIFSHGALTNGGFAIAKAYFEHDVDTVIYIHIAPGELSQIKKLDKGQLVISGHISSDSIGINPFLDELEKRECQITSLGGLIR
ncbi:MAG: hypothetical protein ACXACP_08040 [Candidatus Hodarchaeales archaeon]|jgi:hypothetical protein